MSSNINLNLAGNICLGFTTAFAANMFHPLYTYKSRVTVGSSGVPFIPPGLPPWNKVRFLYRGVFTGIILDIFQNTVLYGMQDGFKNVCGNELIAAAANGAFSALPISFGENIIVNLQTSEMSLKEALRRAAPLHNMRSFVRGFAITALRESPYGVALFALPKILEPMLPIPEPTLQKISSGAISGMIVGFCTTPVDMIKTNVQANGWTIGRATAHVFNEFRNSEGRRKFYRASAGRTMHIGLVIGVMKYVEHLAMSGFPDVLRVNHRTI